MMLLIPLLTILLGLLMRTGAIKISGSPKDNISDRRNSSRAVLSIGVVLALLEIYPKLNLKFSPSARLIVDICLFALLLIVPIFFMRQHAQKKMASPGSMNKIYAGYIIFSCFLLLFVYSIREPSISIVDKKLYIGSIFSIEVELKDIDSTWIMSNKVKIHKKLSGFDFLNHYRGKFKVEGSKYIHWLYMDMDSEMLLYIKLKNSEVIVVTRSETNTLNSLRWMLESKSNEFRL